MQVLNNITLLLAAYSPELNPMEKAWDHLRQTKLCTQVCYDDIVLACETA